MINYKKYNLTNIIFNDLLYYSKLPIILLVTVLISAFLVIKVTNKTRFLTASCEYMLLNADILEMEWRNLILEESLLEDYNRVERIATEELQMQHIIPSQENIVIYK